MSILLFLTIGLWRKQTIKLPCLGFHACEFWFPHIRDYNEDSVSECLEKSLQLTKAPREAWCWALHPTRGDPGAHRPSRQPDLGSRHFHHLSASSWALCLSSFWGHHLYPTPPRLAWPLGRFGRNDYRIVNCGAYYIQPWSLHHCKYRVCGCPRARQSVMWARSEGMLLSLSPG